MSTEISKPLTEEQADLKAVIAHAFHGTPVDPEVSKRVRERGEKVREELRQKGVTDVAVDLIRAHRDE